MIEITIDIIGEDASRKMEKFAIALESVSREQITELAKWIRKSARIRAPEDTGELKKSIDFYAPQKTDDGWVIDWNLEAYNKKGVNYVEFQEYGFRGHYTKVSHLAHPYKRSGAVWVEKPYKPGGYFFGPAIESARPYVEQLLRGMTKKAARRAGLGGGT